MKFGILVLLFLVGSCVGQRRPPPPGGRGPPGGGRPPPRGERLPPPGTSPFGRPRQGGGRLPPQGSNGGNAGLSTVADSDVVSSARQKAQQGICQATGQGGPPRSRVVRQLGPPRGSGRRGQGGAGGGQCSAVEGQCGKGLSSIYHEEVINVNGQQKRLVVTNGIPSHVYHDFSGTNRRQNPNEACRTPTYMVLPLNPENGGFTESSLGPVGIASSGAFFYNHKDGQNQVAAISEERSFDNCNGHADPMCRYHYHKAPVCMSSSCSLVGYLRDGFPVYGICDLNGKRLKSCYRLSPGASGLHTSDYTFTPGSDCDLDQANGYTFPGGNYGYIFTENYPFIMPGFMGTQITDLCSL